MQLSPVGTEPMTYLSQVQRLTAKSLVLRATSAEAIHRHEPPTTEDYKCDVIVFMLDVVVGWLVVS